jgi:hypothetical protein
VKHALLMTLLRIIGSKKVMRRLTACASNDPGRSEVLFIMLLRNLTKLNFYAERELAVEEDYWDFWRILFV